MAARRRLEVEEATAKEDVGPKLKFEEACVLVTTVALVAGIIMILIKLGSTYDAGPFAG